MNETQVIMVGETGVGKSSVGNSLLEKEPMKESEEEKEPIEDGKKEKEAVGNTAVGEMRVVMVGKTGVGKSGVGNSLLKKKYFQSNTWAGSVTSRCKFGSRKLEDGINLVLVDTPGIFDTAKSNMATSKEVIRCIGLSSPGPHAFFFVLKIGRYTAEERDTIQCLKNIFGTEVMRYVIVIFTCKDNLDEEEITLDEYISKAPPELNELIAECNGRFVAINNRAKPDERERDIHEIFQVIRKTMTENGGKHYTGEMYEAAEEAFKEKLRLLEEEKHKKERELDQRAKKLDEESLNMKKKLDEDMAARIAALEEEQRQRDLESKKREEELARETERLNNLRLAEEREQRCREEKMKQLAAENEEERRKIKEEREKEAKERERRLEKEIEEERERRLEKERMEREERKEREEMRRKLEEEQKKRIKEIEEETKAEKKRLKEEREKLEKENERERWRKEVQDNDNFFVATGKAVVTAVEKGWNSFVSWFK